MYEFVGGLFLFMNTMVRVKCEFIVNNKNKTIYHNPIFKSFLKDFINDNLQNNKE